MLVRMEKKVLTLCIIYQHPRVLLGMKKIGFGRGRWNGFGGKVEQQESIEEAAKREVLEEAGIRVRNMKKTGVIEFAFKNEPDFLEVHVFCASEFTGEPTESDEMRPQWFPVGEIPYASMWPDDALWLPLLLAGKKFTARFLFEGHDRILEHSLQELNPVAEVSI